MAAAQTALQYPARSDSSNTGLVSSLGYAQHPQRTSFDSQTSSHAGSHLSHRSYPTRPHPTHIMSETDRTSNPSSKSKSASTGVSSQHSSISGRPRRYTAELRPSRRLRSQYPRGATENHVEYILVASFDIDKGPIMEHQFPVAITGDENMLAELMLPDGAHVRNQDWTIFFLHKDTSQEEEQREQSAKEERRRKRRRKRDKRLGIAHESEDDEDEDEDEEAADDTDDDASTDSEGPEGEGPPLIYVLNLVFMKQDKTVKRGAVVKAMAICTRHPFLHIYKPLLLLALEEYFKAPVPETLSMLYDAVNAMDLSLMPKLSMLERHLLQGSENKDLFIEKFEQMIHLRMEQDRRRNGDFHPFDASHSPVRRPEIHRAGTRAQIQGSGGYCIPRDTHEFESKVMYKGIPIPIKVPVAVMPENVGDFSLIKLIQNFSDTHAKSPQPFALHPHLTTNGPLTHPIMVLVNALLTQKRVIFLGHNMPSGEVAEAVLAACALASGGVLRGFTRHAFPYTDLTKIDDLLNVPGFIAGVTNPTFEMHPEWWDVLCDLPSGRIKISTKIEAAPATEGLIFFQQQNPAHASLVGGQVPAQDVTGDTAFMVDILKSVAARHGERVVRSKWRDWIVKFTRIAAAFEESVYGASALALGPGADGADASGSNGVAYGHGYVWHDETAKQRELAGNATRIEGWRNTRSYYSCIQDMAQFFTVKPVKGLDLAHLHDRLRTQRLTQAQTREIFLTLAKHIRTYDEICLLLSVAPEGHAGLFYIALGLFHKDREVRLQTAQLLERIGEHEAGQHWWNGMSRFEKLAYVRIKREAEHTGTGASRRPAETSPVDERVV